MSELDQRLAKMTPLQRAVFALQETQNRLETLEKQYTQPIAIVGMACRFPGGADDPRSYWRLLHDGRDVIREVPSDRWDADAFYDADPNAPGKMNTRWGGFLERIDEFDNHFFGVSDREATRIDPQHRLLLELAWEALEDAGMPPSNLRGSRTGVFIGISHSEYGMMLSTDLAQTDAFVSTGTAHCIAANRISFLFDFYGPSVALDTACSSSLVSVHIACQSLRQGESEIALAGGVNLLLSPMATINLTKAGFSAADGRIHAFDAAASGYVRSEGAGVIVLKPLEAAIASGDPIYAVIRGSAVNQNGFSNGLTAPSRQAQERVLRQAYAAAKRSPAQVQYIETQGTGTRLGDAIEAMALGHVLREGRQAGSYCRIGSVKTNLGHLECASGVASLMKVALAMQHGELPATLHFQTPNLDIPFDELPVRVQHQLEPWRDSENHPRLAGVSGFGFGGSNAHVVLEQVPADATPPTPAGVDDQLRVLTLSARTAKALQAQAHRYCDFLRNNSSAWSDICYTAAVRRDHHDCRLALLATSSERATGLLEAHLQDSPSPDLLVGRKPFGRDVKAAFVFDGQPDQWSDGAAGIRQLITRLAGTIDHVDAALQRAAGWNLGTALANADCWQNRVFALPVITALQIALTDWWRRAGVLPQVVLGCGIGELAAACAAGILTLDDTLKIAVACGRGEEPSAWAGVQHRHATLPFLSAWDGQQHDGRTQDSDRWQCCLEQSTGLDAALNHLKNRQPDVCLEIGPSSQHERLVRELAGPGGTGIVVTPLAEFAGNEDSVQEALAVLYAAGVDLRWNEIIANNGRFVRVPTYPWQRQRLWAVRPDWLAGKPAKAEQANITPASAPDSNNQTLETAGGQAAVEEIRSRPDLNTPYVAPRTPLDETLTRAWSEILKIDRVGMHDNFFELGGDSLQAMILHNLLQEQLGEIIQGYVLFQAQTVKDLAAYLRKHFAAPVLRLHPDEPDVSMEETTAALVATIGDKEVADVRRLLDVLAPVPPVSYPIHEKNRRAVFILSPSRSGSTLFRVMLAGHDRLFAPPELELLWSNTIAEQRIAFSNVPGQWLEGLVRTVMEVQGRGVDEARRLMREWEASGTTVQQAYHWLQASLGERLLVDKTPSYSGCLPVLQRAEELFEEPLYLHLLRHPCGMIRSYVDYHLYEEFRMRFNIKDSIPFTPRQIAELVWVISHQNILQLLRHVPPSRHHRVRFEDAVRYPEETMRGVCQFLGLDYRAEMIHPYDHPERKMVDGVVSQGRMHGDQKFVVKHKSIDPAVADDWKQHLSSGFLGSPARRLAADFGYDDLDAQVSAPKGVGSDVTVDTVSLATAGSSLGEAADLLRRLDELSDDEVATLLQTKFVNEARHD